MYLGSHKRGAASYDEVLLDGVTLRDFDKTPTQEDMSSSADFNYFDSGAAVTLRRVRGKSV
jgi:hypothetical protein